MQRLPGALFERRREQVPQGLRRNDATLVRRGPEPEVFREAQNWIGAPGFRIRGSASYASAVYSGVFCLLAMRNARDWRRGEDIRLQELQDHHIFPQAYLKRHGITKRVDVNTIANRTLISNETNGKIKDKAPADYLTTRTSSRPAARIDLLEPHFIDDATCAIALAALEDLTNDEAADVYGRFLQAREAEIIQEIRRVCGVAEDQVHVEADTEPDDVAGDIKAGASPSDDTAGELELEAV